MHATSLVIFSCSTSAADLTIRLRLIASVASTQVDSGRASITARMLFGVTTRASAATLFPATSSKLPSYPATAPA